MNQKSFLQIKKNLKKDFSDFKKIKLGILGDSSTQFLNIAIKGLAYDYNLNLDIWESDYNQIQLQVFNKNSDLYSFNPDILLIFKSSHKLLQKYNSCNKDELTSFADEELDAIKNIYTKLSEYINSKIIFYNYTEINDFVFGNYANKVESSFIYQLRKINYLLMDFSTTASKFHICDLSSIQNQIGKEKLFHPSSYINNSMVLSIEAISLVAKNTLDIIKALIGRFNKCIILDLDNTTWGGIIGDDGVEKLQIGNLGIGKAFSEFQLWIKKLKTRGIIIAICSKNTENIAMEPFKKHPEMVLKLDDISVFVANWDNKADNIRYIQQVLNIGFDSIVFIDDNPFERNIVRENLPDICVPEMPEDPAEYLEYLYGQNLFETTTFSNEDSERTRKYQIESKRVASKKKHTNESDYLKSLNMNSKILEFNNFNTPRISQLSQRSNQFNLRTIRYNEEDVCSIIESDKHFGFTFDLKDRFGEYGIICVLVLKQISYDTLFIENWLMSCRVLKRGMEKFTLNYIVNFGKKNNYAFITGEYIESKKNNLVKNHFFDLGFKKKNNKWILQLRNYSKLKTDIN